MIRYLWSIVVLKEPVICYHIKSIVEERQIFNSYSLRKKNHVMCMVTEGESFHLHHRRVDMQRWKISHPISQKLTRVLVPPHNWVKTFLKWYYNLYPPTFSRDFLQWKVKTLYMFCTWFQGSFFLGIQKLGISSCSNSNHRSIEILMKLHQ